MRSRRAHAEITQSSHRELNKTKPHSCGALLCYALRRLKRPFTDFTGYMSLLDVYKAVYREHVTISLLVSSIIQSQGRQSRWGDWHLGIPCTTRPKSEAPREEIRNGKLFK